ncbi:MAG: type II secretion system F family protein [Veillonella sp.]|uniref:type II secretion system F family protein n=1 Tax=Veillonella sp. TaxID=1926307 RepID=UPI0025E4FA78|nr:type II secretion system F family protein [Veillonella sp.]MBS4913889.1 type II secretion system F family protein [Veillonella sp.]
MKSFVYRAYDEKGVVQENSLWAESLEDVKLKLAYRGWKIIQIEIGKGGTKGAKKWAYKDVVQFSYRMQLLLDAGISIRRIMQFLSARKSKKIPYALINELIQQGHQISDVLETTQFPRIGQTLVRAGEAAGTLGQSFKQVKDYYEKQLAWRQQMLSALTYPLFLMVLMLIFMMIAIGFIIPAFKKVFTTMDVPLPWITKAIFDMGDYVTAHPVLSLMIPTTFVALIIVLCTYEPLAKQVSEKIWKMGAGHEWFDCFFLARMTEIWAILLDAGVSMTSLLPLSEPLWGNSYASALQRRVTQKVREGAGFSEALQAENLGNEFLWELVLIGEESGSMVDMLKHCSVYYEQLMNRYMKKVEQLMEPLMISLMGIGVAVLVIAVMLPMFNAVSAIQNI